jgi:hypothetical protein
MAVKLGMAAVLNRNTGSFASPTWNPIPNVKDLTLSLETGEADATTRGNNGWRATVATLKDASLEFEMVWDTEDDDFTAIRNAFLNNTPIEMAVLDGAHSVPGSQGLRASFMVTSFTRNEPLEEVITVSVSLKPTYSVNAPAWMTTT